MAEEKTMRLSLVAKQINVGTSTILQFLSAKGHKVDNNPNAKLNFEQLTLLAKEYGANHLLEDSEPAKKPIEEPAAPVAAPAPVAVVAPAQEPVVEKIPEPVAVVTPVAEVVVPEPVVEKPVVEAPAPEKEEEKQIGLKVLGRIELDKKGNPVAPKPAPKPVEEPKAPVAPAPESVKVEAPAPAPVVPAAPVVEEIELIEAKGDTLKGLTVLGKIELPMDNDRSGGHKHKRKRIIKEEKKPVANEQRPAPAGGGANKGKDFGKKTGSWSKGSEQRRIIR